MPSNDPEYQKRYIRQHYQNNKDYYKKKAKARTERYRGYLRTFSRKYKTLCGCSRCGNKDHRVLEYHHRGNKDDNIADALWITQIALESYGDVIKHRDPKRAADVLNLGEEKNDA